jgi:TorA maturation chaperone TorD
METLKTRANMYEIVKRAFCQPDEALTAEIESGEFARRIQEIVDHCCSLTARCCLPSDLMEDISGLSRSINDQSNPGEFLESLHVEYMRLFVNAFPTLWAPPYESYYVEKRMMGKPALDCMAIYKEDGLALNEKGELPDHIVTQLEYLHFLCLAEMQALENGDGELQKICKERAAKFYEDHIINWVPAFCEQIQTHSRVEFYTIMSRLLKNFSLLENRGLNADKLDPFEEVGHDEVTRA